MQCLMFKFNNGILINANNNLLQYTGSSLTIKLHSMNFKCMLILFIKTVFETNLKSRGRGHRIKSFESKIVLFITQSSNAWKPNRKHGLKGITGYETKGPFGEL